MPDKFSMTVTPSGLRLALQNPSIAPLPAPLPPTPTETEALRSDFTKIAGVAPHLGGSPALLLAETREAKATIRDVINLKFPVGSPYRRIFVHRLQTTLAEREYAFAEMNLRIFKTILRRPLRVQNWPFENSKRFSSESLFYLEFLPLALDLLLTLNHRGVPLLKSEEQKLVETDLETLNRLPRLPHLESPNSEALEKRLDRFFSMPSGEKDPSHRRDRLMDLLKRKVFGGECVDAGGFRVAVVGYGMNLDTISFFVRLGFLTTAVEKRGSSEGWGQFFEERPPQSWNRFFCEMGLSEIMEETPHWMQFTPEEVVDALRNPPNLKVLDVSDPQLDYNSFDLVVAPTLTDEAFETTASLIRPGGHLLVDHVRHRIYRVTADDRAFREEAGRRLGIQFETLFSEPFRSSERILPSDYCGEHQVYLLHRASNPEFGNNGSTTA